MSSYVHGYHETEAGRLCDQAEALTDILHRDTRFPAGALVLEAGCGVGAQTRILAARSPEACFTALDISAGSLRQAEIAVRQAGITNVSFQRADIFSLPFAAESFDHVFICFVLEHLDRVAEALASLYRVLRPGGTLTVIEGDHGSFYCHPRSHEAEQAVNCLIRLQAKAGGNSLIGRELYPLLTGSGFRKVRVSPRLIYTDASRPELVEGFSRKTFIAMVEGVGQEAVEAGLVSEEAWEKGIADLYRATGEEGSFLYTFFKAVGGK